MTYCFEFLKTFSARVVAIQIIFGVFRWLYGNIIGPHFLEPKNLRQYGNWALVTGATDGIGKQLRVKLKNNFFMTSFQLAKRGLNIILVARTLSKLESVAKEISETFNVETQVVTVNFTSGPEIYDQIKQQIVGKEIGILVNNVGMFYPAPDLFLNIPDREKLIQDIIRCNITSVPMMCSLILPQMVERKRGLIINISSLTSDIPGPSMLIYAASKAFVTKFSADLGAEYEDQGIDVQGLVTGTVSTNMNKVESGTFTVPTPSQYVESALRSVGYSRYTTGFFAHSILRISLQFINFIAPTFTEGLVKKQKLAVRDEEIKRGSYTPVK